VTLPASLDHISVEPAGDAVLLRPAAAFPVERYTKRRVAQFDAADAQLAKR